MSSNIESHSKLLKDDPNVEMVGGPKSKAQPVMHLSDVNFFFDISDVSSPLKYFICWLFNLANICRYNFL